MDEIIAVEDKLGFKIPSQYIDFLLNQCGGLLVDFYGKRVNKGEDVLITQLFSITDEDGIEGYRNTYTLSDAYPLDERYLWLLPFGGDGADNIFCFSIREEDFGQVYLLNMNREMPYVIADSFLDFIEGMEKIDWENE
jgi:hypothetical protein